MAYKKIEKLKTIEPEEELPMDDEINDELEAEEPEPAAEEPLVLHSNPAKKLLRADRATLEEHARSWKIGDRPLAAGDLSFVSDNQLRRWLDTVNSIAESPDRDPDTGKAISHYPTLAQFLGAI